MTLQEHFRQAAHRASTLMGSPWSFCGAVSVIVLWAFTGPLFGFSDTWQLVINTGTTIVTFLMVFLIQNTQNRDSKALQLKLDELIRSKKGARNSFIELENLSDDVLFKLETEFKALRAKDSDLDQALDEVHQAIKEHKQSHQKEKTLS